MTPFTARGPALRLPPALRASRWRDVETANRFTTEVLRAHEARLRAALARSEPFVELRSAVPADAGTLFVRRGRELEEVEVSAAVVRMDLSGPSPVVLASYPESVELFDEAWDLLQVLTRCGSGAAEYWDDPRAAVDAALAGDPHRADAALRQWRTLLGGRPDGGAVRDLLRRVSGSVEGSPDGVDWADWAVWFEAHLADVAEGRSAVTLFPTGATRASRTAEFDDLDVEPLVASALEDARPQPATRRFVVRAELDRTVGTVTTTGPALTVAATGLAVVLRDDGADGTTVLDAHPDLPRPTALVQRFPVAAELVPAYFGPSVSRVDVLPWPAQRALLTHETAEVVAAFARELVELGARGEETLTNVLRGLGAAVVPSDAGAWASRLVWRSRRFDWRA